MRFSDATAIRRNGVDAVEARLNGELIWSASPSWIPTVLTGGTVEDTTIDGRLYRVHTYAGTGDIECTQLGTDPSARVLWVGGGGSGGTSTSMLTVGGSGAGGSVLESTIELSVGTHAYQVGAGGAATTGQVSGLPGGSTTAFGETVLGGAGGGAYNTGGGNMTDGNGGGAGGTNGPFRNGGSGANAGGDTIESLVSTDRAAAGGAGAGGRGGDAVPTLGGAGGAGILSGITGTPTWYGVGAGGSVRSGQGNTVGVAVGGANGVQSGTVANSGQNGRGNGGSGNGGAASGAGGHGSLIVRIPLEPL